MSKNRFVWVVAATLLSLGVLGQASSPDEWTDPDTGHKVVRLSRRDGANETPYFHQNPFTAQGDKMVFMGATAHGRSVFTVDLKTLDIREITPGRNIGFEVVAPKRRELFYLSGNTVYATHLDTLETREVATVPERYGHGRGLSVNSDETLLAGCYGLGEEKFQGLPRKEMIWRTFEAKLPNALYTIEIAAGKTAEFYHANTWLGHVQFSPSDPTLIEFCHEGPGRLTERMRLIRADGTDLRKVYESGARKTLVTHEFWTPEGQGLWFDLQIPRLFLRNRMMAAINYAVGPHFYLARTDITTGQTTQYTLHRHQRSWHYNIAPDGRILCGDGEGRYSKVSKRGRWITLYRPEGRKMRAERLCSMRSHSYTIAPNTHFTPDGKWVVFTSDQSGTPQVYAVEAAPSSRRNHER